MRPRTTSKMERAIKAGKVTVNGIVATMDTVVKDNELVTHRVHRHEPPVSAMPLSIIHQDDDLIVINKPASIPVHPCGRYRHNTVVILLAKEHNLPNLHTVHRLDRLTSGLLLFARSLSKAKEMEAEIRERRVAKVYVCRVEGEFPSEPVECSEPILVVTHKVGVCRVDPQGKDCSTRFTRLSFNGTTSVVKCEPRTGRMHQIRVHLQWLGHPIVNDPIYNHPAWKQTPCTESDCRDQSNIDRIISEIVRTNYSSELDHEATSSKKPAHTEEKRTEGLTTSATQITGKEDTEQRMFDTVGQDRELLHCSVETGSIEELVRSDTSTVHLMKDTSDGQLPRDDRASYCGVTGCGTGSEEESPSTVTERTGDEVVSKMAKQPVASVDEADDGGKDVTVDPDCSECQLNRPDPSPSDLLMYLHALSYKGENWEFCTPMPNWAQPDWTGDCHS